MALNAFLSVSGLKGSARQKHAAGKSIVNGFEHEIDTARNAETGQPSGKPKHRAMIVNKEIDLASPGLHKAMAEGTVFPSVSVDFWRMPPGGGVEASYYTVVLSKARVASIRTVMLHRLLQENQLVSEYEEVSFTYESINWKFTDKDSGSDSASETECNPAPDKLNEMAKTALGDAAKSLGKKISDAAKAIAGEKAGEVTTPPQ